jgi:hypothetical protein
LSGKQGGTRMKRSIMMGFMLLSILLTLSFGVSAADKEELLKNINSLSIPPELAARLMLDFMNTSMLNGTLLTGLTSAIGPELGNMAFPQSETIAGNTDNEPTNIILVQNVSFNIILIQNLTEITNTVMPLSMNNLTKNMTIAAA